MANGNAVVEVNGLAEGTYSMDVIFNGDINYNPLIKTSNLVIREYRPLNFTVDFEDMYVNFAFGNSYDLMKYPDFYIRLFTPKNTDGVFTLFIDGKKADSNYTSESWNDEHKTYFFEDVNAGILSEGKHIWLIKYSNDTYWDDASKSGEFNMEYLIPEGYAFAILENKSVISVDFDEIRWDVARFYENITDDYGTYTVEYELSKLKIGGVDYTLINGIYPPQYLGLYLPFNPSEYVYYDNVYYKIENGIISEIIEDYESFGGIYYKLIGIGGGYDNGYFHDVGSEGYVLVDGKCYNVWGNSFQGVAFGYGLGFFYESNDFKIVNGKYYTPDGELIEDIADILGYDDKLIVINSTLYRGEDNYLYPVHTLTPGNPYIMINNKSCRLVYGEEDNEYAVVNGKLYSVANGNLGSAINLAGLKQTTQITANTVNTNYGNGQLIATLKDAKGNALANMKISIQLNGKTTTLTTDNNGQVKLSTSTLEPGQYNAVITFNGNDKYERSQTTSKITINKLNTDFSINNALKELTVTFSNDVGGSITVKIANYTYTATVKNSKATISTANVPSGKYDAKITYSGDKIYNSKEKTFQITVNSDINIKADDVVKYYKGSERFKVTLTTNKGTPISNAKIKITINGQTYEKTTNDNGAASIPLGLNSGKYSVTTEYNGSKVYSTVTIKDTVIASDFSKIYKNGTQYRGTFVDSKGNLLKNTEVMFNINGVMYTRKTNDLGIARMNINLNAGTYVLTATNPSTGEQHTTTITVLPNIVENKDLTKYYKNSSQYIVRLLDDTGKPVGKGVEVSFNINGVFYTRTTNENGYARLNINLGAGDYIITAEYKGHRESNKIKILPILKADDLYMTYRDGSQFKARLVDGQGNALSNKTVTFNINGVFYQRTTGIDGIAKLNIKLMAGKYIITSSYNGCNIANEVLINSAEEFYYGRG